MVVCNYLKRRERKVGFNTKWHKEEEGKVQIRELLERCYIHQGGRGRLTSSLALALMGMGLHSQQKQIFQQ